MAVTINGTTGIVTPDIGVDGSTLVIDAANNRVGVLEDSPNNTLTVGDTVQPSYAPTRAGNYIEIARTSGADAGLLINKNTGQWLVGINNSDGANAPLRFEYAAAGSSHPGLGAGTLGMIIKHDGVIGINTDASTNPSGSKLVVGGRIQSNDGGYWFGGPTGAEDGWHVQQSSDDLVIVESGVAERLRIDSSGNAVLRTANGAFKSENPNSSGDYVRMYAGAGTAQWDIYGNGELLRMSENSGNSAARVQFDLPTTHRSTSTTTGIAALTAQQEVNNGGYLIFDGKNSSGTSVFNVTHNGRVRVSDGIDFSANSNATGMTSELLDDYEEGTWTPVLRGSTTDPTYNGSQSGNYTKVGNMVTCWGYIDTNPVTGAGSGNISISGLPFASGLPTASTFNGSVAVYGPTFSGTLSSRINNTSTSIIFYQIASNTAISQWTFATASWSSGDAIYFQVSYTVG